MADDVVDSESRKRKPRVAIESFADAGLTPARHRVAGLSEQPDDAMLEANSPSIRPSSFDEYPGQESVKENLKVYVDAAKRRGKSLDHVIFHGPPGLGKTTLANIVARELGAPFHSTSGPAIDKAGDLAGILSGLEAGAVLFIDEIHRLSVKIEELLYSAMEDFAIDVLIGQGPSARSIRMDLPQFTLIGATTRLSLLSRPLLSRFGIQERLDFYDVGALVQILNRSAGILDIPLNEDGAQEIASRSRGTPRLANRLLKRVWDFTEYEGGKVIDKRSADFALLRQGMDPAGLDRTDRAILEAIAKQYDGGPVGIETLAVTLNEDRATLEDVYEPYLVHRGFVARSPRGRTITAQGLAHLGMR